MELRREFILTIGILVFLNIIFAFGAIGLFVRMGPAIDRILQQNVYSIVAAEEIMEVLTEHGDTSISTEGKNRILDALKRAKRNVTEPGEASILKAIEQNLSFAFEGNREKRTVITKDIKKLITINREAMKKAGRTAQRLGSAGAWAAVFVGFFSFTLSLIIMNRLRRRFLMPMMELHHVLESFRRGEKLRRCSPGDSPMEVRQVIQSVNSLLDERLKRLGG